MSLQSLTQLRASGRAPAALWVVVGNCPASIKHLPDTIAVADKPMDMDWRPVVGLHVDVFDLSGDGWLLAQTMDAIEAAKPKCIGVACDAGVLGLSEDHERVLWRIWKHLEHHS